MSNLGLIFFKVKFLVLGIYIIMNVSVIMLMVKKIIKVKVLLIRVFCNGVNVKVMMVFELKLIRVVMLSVSFFDWSGKILDIIS